MLGQTPEELGLVRDLKHSFTPPSSPFVLLASANADAEKGIVAHLKTTLKGRGITCWSTRQLGKQSNGNTAANLWEVVQATDALLVAITPQSRSSRHVRRALAMAGSYQRPVCGIWLEGERWEECLPEERVDFAAVIDARGGDTPGTLEAVATALAHLLFASQESTETVQQPLSDPALGVATRTPLPAEKQASPHPPERLAEPVPPQSKQTDLDQVPPQRSLEPTNGARPLPAGLPQPTPPNVQIQQKGLSRIRVGLLVVLAILVVGGGILGSLSLLTHFGAFGTHGEAGVPTVVRGGTWIDELFGDAVSLIPNGPLTIADWQIEQALYLPLFYGDPQGEFHAAAATEVPTLQNGGISPDARTWTFQLRPHLVWSDGRPYDARDVDYTWRLWLNPAFNPTIINGPTGLQVISSADVSADHLSITFHLKRPYVPFLQDWVDGGLSPLPAHHFRAMAPDQILKSPDNLNPQVVSGPFVMAESVPGNHYTVVRNPRYYLARQGLPYLDKVVFRVATSWDAILKDLRAGTIDSASFLDVSQMSAYQRLQGYTLVTPPTSNNIQVLLFNFHNTVLATHLEVRQAIALAIDHQALIRAIPQGLATPLCTEHGTFYHPGYQPHAPCPFFNPGAANQLLDDNGWVRGPDGVRSKGNERLEFEFSTSLFQPWRVTDQAIIQRDLQAIGIKLDIQNYPDPTFTNSFLTGG
ncbi:MAG: hypothetical protein NVSMB27_44060 [Ktedonobacteraceae bacterium]